MKEFVLYDKECGFNGEDILRKHNWLFNIPFVSLTKVDNKSSLTILSNKIVAVARLDSIDDLLYMIQVSPLTSFNINHLIFPRIELD